MEFLINIQKRSYPKHLRKNLHKNNSCQLKFHLPN